GNISLNPDAAAKAQVDQYQRDAEATGTQRSFLLAADIANVQATAARATQEAMYAQATFSAAATHDEAARIANATATTIYERQLTETAAAFATATTIANAQATQTQQIETTRVAIALAAEQARVEQDRLINTVAWIITLAVIVLALSLLTWLGVVGIHSVRKRLSLVTHGPFDSPLLILDAPNGGQIIVDPQRLFGPATIIDAQGRLLAPELAHPMLQERATSQAQMVALQQATHNPYQTAITATHKRAPSVRRVTETAPNISWGRDTPQPAPSLSIDAPWGLLNAWHGGGLPLGMSESGLLIVDPEAFPHFLFAGTTGSGKTRFGLRPLITAALADGWHVSIFDRSGLDFQPFQQHPNASLVILEDPSDSIDYLATLYDVVHARFEWMMKVGASTWGRAPGRKPPRVLAVFDEFSNLADSLTGAQREEVWRHARMIAAEGRKAGVHLALALQDPTHRSIDLRIRRNCVPLSFRVKDGEASRVVLGTSGAETLPPRHFLTVIHDLTRAVAFSPDDDQIQTFLAARRVPVHPKPDWAGN
ncbi:MAG TPA: hypothetical protein VI547_08060, partial [Anaerolineales bacterium]|nr:hypothetical protein [Anaerolineales bacterium]